MKSKTSKRRLLSCLLALVMILSMFAAMTVTASAAPANQKVNNAKNGVVQVQIWFNDPETAVEEFLGYGTGFLINEDTVVTCQHVVTGFSKDFYVYWAEMTNDRHGGNRTATDIKNCLEIRISVLRDVYVKATVKKASTEMDYAILTLNDKIHNREVLAIRNSETLKQTEDVFALGFPGDIEDLMQEHQYTASDVTITTGSVNKVGNMSFIASGIDPEGNTTYTEYNGVNCVESSAHIAGGNSGGPLVDVDGNVVGINAAGDGTRNIAVSSKQLIEVLDALGISYTDGQGGGSQVEEEDEKDDPVTTPAAPVTTPSQNDQADSNDTANGNEKEEEGSNIVLIAIIAGGVILVLVIVILIVALGKKKPQAAPAPAPAPAPYQPPQRPVAPAPAPRPVAPAPAPAPRPVAPVSSETTVLSQGAGETTVLGGGAGETSVLSQNVNGGTLVRASNNERIPICSAEFVVGRERSSVDYCIGGNTNISRVHARFVVRNGSTFIVDNKAANGTFVNGVKARAGQEIELKSGDKILLADEKFEFIK